MIKNWILKSYLLVFGVLTSCISNENNFNQNLNIGIDTNQNSVLSERDSIFVKQIFLKLDSGTVRINNFLEGNVWEIFEICVKKDDEECKEFKDSITVNFKQGKFISADLNINCSYNLSPGGAKIWFEECSFFSFEELSNIKWYISKGKENFILIYSPLENEKTEINKITIKFIRKV